ncbi:hypothetical protein EJB05_00561, partial [Eragrostis curvula]
MKRKRHWRDKERERDHEQPFKVVEITPLPRCLGIRYFPPYAITPLPSRMHHTVVNPVVSSMDARRGRSNAVKQPNYIAARRNKNNSRKRQTHDDSTRNTRKCVMNCQVSSTAYGLEKREPEQGEVEWEQVPAIHCLGARFLGEEEIDAARRVLLRRDMERGPGVRVRRVDVRGGDPGAALEQQARARHRVMLAREMQQPPGAELVQRPGGLARERAHGGEEGGDVVGDDGAADHLGACVASRSDHLIRAHQSNNNKG